MAKRKTMNSTTPHPMHLPDAVTIPEISTRLLLVLSLCKTGKYLSGKYSASNVRNKFDQINYNRQS